MIEVIKTFEAECADVFYKNFSKMPEDVRKRLSIYQLSNVMRFMVLPVIEYCRSDRGDKESSKQTMTPEQAQQIWPYEHPNAGSFGFFVDGVGCRSSTLTLEQLEAAVVLLRERTQSPSRVDE